MDLKTMDELMILKAIPSTEESSFNEFCRALGDDKPETGNRAEWKQLFMQLEKLEIDGLVGIERQGRSIDTLILTESGAARVKASK